MNNTLTQFVLGGVLQLWLKLWTLSTFLRSKEYERKLIRAYIHLAFFYECLFPLVFFSPFFYLAEKRGYNASEDKEFKNNNTAEKSYCQVPKQS